MSRQYKKIGKKKETRPSYEVLGISRERVRELKVQCRSGAFDLETMRFACNGDLDFLKKWLIVSVRENLSFDDLEVLCVQGKIERPPIGRTDFYAYRRLFFRNLDEATKAAGHE